MYSENDLREKCDELNRITQRDPHNNESFYVAHLYWRSRYPYILGCQGKHLARGTKEDLIIHMDMIILGYNLTHNSSKES